MRLKTWFQTFRLVWLVSNVFFTIARKNSDIFGPKQKFHESFQLTLTTSFKSGTDTSKTRNAGGGVTCVAESFQFSCLCTLHDIKHLPQHRAGQSSIRHLRHKQPNAQPVGGPQIFNIGIILIKIETQADFSPFVSEHV